MASIKHISIINQSQLKFFTTKDLQGLFKIKAKRTVEDLIKKLIEEKVLGQLEKGKYQVINTQPSSFEIAQFLYSPSYISFETALNYHGILSQFPTEITSATTKKRAVKCVENTTYSYSKISSKLFTGYYKEDTYLIASPEKALFDQFYMISKSLKTEEYLNEMDYSQVNLKKFVKYVNLFSGNYKKTITEIINKYL